MFKYKLMCSKSISHPHHNSPRGQRLLDPRLMAEPCIQMYLLLGKALSHFPRAASSSGFQPVCLPSVKSEGEIEKMSRSFRNEAPQAWALGVPQSWVGPWFLPFPAVAHQQAV